MFAEVQDAHLKNLAKVRSWQSNLEAYFKTSYKVSAKVINGVAVKMHVYRKFVRALDKKWQSILHESGSFRTNHARRAYSESHSSPNPIKYAEGIRRRVI